MRKFGSHSDKITLMSEIGAKLRIGQTQRGNPLSAEDQLPISLDRAEIDSAIRSLSVADWNRLRRTAALYAANRPIDAEELLQEAFRRSLDGSRKCPRTVDIVRFLCEAVRSIAHGEQDKTARRPDHLPLEIETGDDRIERQLPSSICSPEDDVRSAEEASQVQDNLLALMDDEAAEIILLGIMDGCSGEELCELAGIDNKTLATKRRYIRRRITAAYPNGWTI